MTISVVTVNENSDDQHHIVVMSDFVWPYHTCASQRVIGDALGVRLGIRVHACRLSC
jgi:hypothetical protein